MPGIPGALAKRRGQDAILDQREADRTHALEFPGYGLAYATAEHAYGKRNASSLPMVDQVLYVSPCAPPTRIIIADKLRVSVATVGGSPLLRVALFRYDRIEKLLRQIPGTAVSWTATATVLEADLSQRPTIRPEGDMLFAGALRNGGTGLLVRGVNTAREVTYGFQLAGQSTMPGQVPLDSFSTGVLWCPSLFYLSNRVTDLL